MLFKAQLDRSKATCSFNHFTSHLETYNLDHWQNKMFWNKKKQEKNNSCVLTEINAH